MAKLRKIRVAAFLSHYYGKAVLDALLSLSDQLEIVCLATDDPLNPASNASRRLWKYGWDESLRQLVTEAASHVGLTPHLSWIYEEAFRSELATAAPDIIVCAVFGQKIPGTMLSLVEQRAYNCHPTIPGYGLDATRGADAVEKAIQGGATAIDITIHRMTEQIDCGEVVGRSAAFEIPPDLWGTRHGSSILRIYRESASLLYSAMQMQLMDIVGRDFDQRK